MQIEIQAVSPHSLSSPKGQEGGADKSPDDAKALPEGAEPSGDYHDVSPNTQGSGNASSSSKAGAPSDRQESGQSQTSTGKESKKKDSSKAGSKSGSSRDAKVAAGSNSGTIGGRGTQEEYQQARVRFMSPTGTGVCVSADSIALGEDQMGLLVTASFDEL